MKNLFINILVTIIIENFICIIWLYNIKNSFTEISTNFTQTDLIALNPLPLLIFANIVSILSFLVTNKVINNFKKYE